MIQANELRFGNIINRINDKFNPAILVETIVNIGHLRNVLDTPELYAAIPLTPEILERCGFENKMIGKDYWELPNDKCINGWSTEFTFYLPYFEMNTYTGRIKIEYLHQLQNIYFALTQTELIINL